MVKPMLKKSGIDPNRPVSNLPFLAKIAEKAVTDQLMEYSTTNHLLPDNQSSTETALVKVYNDVRASMDNQEITFFILIDLSAAFDTIYQILLMSILDNDFGIVGVVKRWFKSFLDERQQRVKDLYWLPIKYRAIFKITLQVFKVLHGLAPS